ncbi:hypothetical protein BDZ89DRAFT_1131416 [Hymenopellis radicata]|nr:hypothetical protein BDZ89DRAFT_1131416 [Hymenopellis radicata]
MSATLYIFRLLLAITLFISLIRIHRLGLLAIRGHQACLVSQYRQLVPQSALLRGMEALLTDLFKSLLNGYEKLVSIAARTSGENFERAWSFMRETAVRSCLQMLRELLWAWGMFSREVDVIWRIVELSCSLAFADFVAFIFGASKRWAEACGVLFIRVWNCCFFTIIIVNILLEAQFPSFAKSMCSLSVASVLYPAADAVGFNHWDVIEHGVNFRDVKVVTHASIHEDVFVSVEVEYVAVRLVPSGDGLQYVECCLYEEDHGLDRYTLDVSAWWEKKVGKLTLTVYGDLFLRFLRIRPTLWFRNQRHGLGSGCVRFGTCHLASAYQPRKCQRSAAARKDSATAKYKQEKPKCDTEQIHSRGSTTPEPLAKPSRRLTGKPRSIDAMPRTDLSSSTPIVYSVLVLHQFPLSSPPVPVQWEMSSPPVPVQWEMALPTTPPVGHPASMHRSWVIPQQISNLRAQPQVPNGVPANGFPTVDLSGIYLGGQVRWRNAQIQQAASIPSLFLTELIIQNGGTRNDLILIIDVPSILQLYEYVASLGPPGQRDDASASASHARQPSIIPDTGFSPSTKYRSPRARLNDAILALVH